MVCSSRFGACKSCWRSGRRHVSFEVFNADGDRTRVIKNRNVIGHAAEQDNPRLRNAAGAVVDDKVIGTPESECAGGEIKLPLDRGQGRRQIAGLFLTEVVAHFDREWQHLDQRSGRVVVDQLGSDLAPVAGNQNAFLCHCRSDQSECDEESSEECLKHSSSFPLKQARRLSGEVSQGAFQKSPSQSASRRTRWATPRRTQDASWPRRSRAASGHCSSRSGYGRSAAPPDRWRSGR